MKIQYPDTLDYGSNATVDATVNAALRSSPDLFTRLKGVNPKILSLKMESLSGLRKLDMLGDGYTKSQV